MKLAISTTKTNSVSVSLLENDGVVIKAEKENAFGSQVILPMIEELLKSQNISEKDLTEIVVDVGPGSFTGTRVGVAIANMLAYSLKIPVNGKQPPSEIATPHYE